MADPKAAMAALQQKYAAYSAETTKAGAAMRALVQKYGDGTKGANGFSGGTTKDPILTAIVNAPKAENKPIANIKAFGADGSGAARTGLAVGAGVKQSAASYLNLAGAFTPGNLTIGEEVRAGNTEAERQKAMQEKKANTQEKVFSAADKLADSAQADIEKANEGASKFGKTLNSVATAGTQLIGDIGMNAIAPGSGLWAMGARTFGSSAQEARRNGATENRQFAYAAANAAVEVLTEKLFGGLISGEEGLIAKGLTKTKGGRALVNLLRNNGGTKLVQDVVDKVSQKAAGRIAVDTIKNFAGEGFEEFVSGVAQPLLDSIYNGKGISENYSELDWQNVLEEVMAGGILGAIGGGAEGVVRPSNIGGTQAAQESVPNAAAQRTNTAEGNLTAEAQSAATAQEMASTAIGDAVSAVRDGGPVTNSVAERIISTDGALAQLGVDPNGKTASQLRGAVKDAIAQMAASEATTAQQTAQPMNEGIAAAGLMVNGRPGITPPGVETRNSLDTNQAVPYTENRTQNVFGGVMNGAENGAGISGNAERGIPGNKDMAAYSGDAGGYTGERGVGNAGQLLSTSRVIADNEGGTSAYSAWLNEARQSDQKNGWAVTPKEPSDLVGATMRVFGDGAAGYAVKDGDLEAVFKNKNKANRRNLFEDILPQAIADGAVKGDCYGENLARLYAHSGAIPVARVEFNEAYANDGWTPDKGRPDIYMLMFSGDDADTVRAKQGTYHIPTVEELKALPAFDKESYDEAAAYRDRLLEQRRTSTQQNVNPTAPLDNLGSARGGFDPLSRAEIQYGTQEGSANAVRPDDMPVSTNGVNRVSESAVTVKGAAVTPDEFVPLLERSVMDNSAPNGLRYMPITNDATVQSAMDTISTEGWESALNQWQKDVSAGRVSEKITAMGAILYNHAVNSGSTQLALDIISDYAANGRAAARGLQAMRILQTLTPDSRLYMIQRSLNKMAEDMNLPDGVKISEETLQEYRDAQTEEARDAAIDKMQGEIADQLWQTRWADGRKLSTLKNKWNALRYVNMLGNFKTQVRNVLGNVGMTAMTRAKDAVAAGVEALASAATGGKIERTKSAFVDRGLLNAAKADFANVEQQAMGESRYSLNEGRGTDATGIVRGAQDKAQVFRFKPLEAYRKATNYAMEKGDVIFSKANYARSLAGWLQAHGITAAQMNDPAWRESNTELLDRGRAYAIKEAQESTFRDNNAVSQLMSKIGRSKDSSVPAKALNVALEGLLPFRKTPANVLVRAEEYSPLGIVNTAVLAAQKAKGNTDITGADIINQASKALTGTGVFILGMALRNAGLLRGGEDEDKDQQYFDQLTGHQNYSLELPDGTSYTLDWITPGSIPLFMGSAMADAVADGGFQLKDLGEAFTKITDPMLEMSMLSGVNDALANIKNTDGGLLPKLAISLGIDYLTQGLTNTMLGQLERIGETERMTYYTDKNSALPDYIQKKLSKASAKIPGWDYQQREWVDAWGQTESTGGLGERVLTNMFSPGYVSKVDIDSVEKELQRLADATGSTTIFPDTAEKSITVNGETIYLDSDKYLKYAKQKGQESAKLCKKLMDSAGYKALSDEDKVDAVRKVYEYATAGAKEKVSDYRVGNSSWINKARSNPMPIQDYIVAYEKYGGSAGIEKQQKIAAAAKQTGMAVDSFTKLKEAESAAVKAKNANSDTNHSRWTKKELMGYIEKNYPKNQWNNAFSTYTSYSNLNWKNPY